MTYHNSESNEPNNNGQEISISPELTGFFKIVNGAKITTSEAQKINEGIIDFLIGSVSLQNYDNSDQNNLSVGENLAQVTIRTYEGEDFTLSNNEDFSLNSEIFSVLNSTYLINRPKVIYIKNLCDFRDRFQDAARYGQRVACIYDRMDNKLSRVSTESPGLSSSITNTDRSFIKKCYTWGCIDG